VEEPQIIQIRAFMSILVFPCWYQTSLYMCCLKMWNTECRQIAILLWKTMINQLNLAIADFQTCIPILGNGQQSIDTDLYSHWNLCKMDDHRNMGWITVPHVQSFDRGS
jgi:hypothetical protein